jgi:homoserine dehydrogenase
VEIFVELIGGCDYALELIEAAIDSGKHVVTANKALIAEHGNALFEKAQAKGVTIAFEASVAGGIPVIKALRVGPTKAWKCASTPHWFPNLNY